MAEEESPSRLAIRAVEYHGLKAEMPKKSGKTGQEAKGVGRPPKVRPHCDECGVRLTEDGRRAPGRPRRTSPRPTNKASLSPRAGALASLEGN